MSIKKAFGLWAVLLIALSAAAHAVTQHEQRLQNIELTSPATVVCAALEVQMECAP